MRTPAFLAVALSFLAFFFGWETWRAWRAPLPATDNGARAPGVLWQPGATVPDPSPPPEAGSILAAIAARPLFRADRQPFREASAGVPARNYEAEMSRFSLLGVLGLGDAPVGVVTRKTGNKTDRWELKAGDALPGFMVQEVRMDGLLLAADGREFLLPLYAGAPTATGGALRTETSQRDAASKPIAPPASAVPPRPGVPAPVSRTPGASPAPVPSGTPPTFTPRYIPGRR